MLAGMVMASVEAKAGFGSSRPEQANERFAGADSYGMEIGKHSLELETHEDQVLATVQFTPWKRFGCSATLLDTLSR